MIRYTIYQRLSNLTQTSAPNLTESSTLEGVAQLLSEESGMAIPERPPIRLLTIEDEVDVRARIKHTLGHFCTVVEAGDAQDGLAALQKQEFDVVLLDIMLPQIPSSVLTDSNGITIIPYIKHIQKYVEVIMMTGYQEKDLILKAFNQYAFDYFDKTSALDDPNNIIEKIQFAADKKYYTHLFDQLLSALEKKLLGPAACVYDYNPKEFAIHFIPDVFETETV